MGEGVRTHYRQCARCMRHLRLPNFATRSHDTGRGYAITDVHVLSHLTPEQKARWWTLPWEEYSPWSATNTVPLGR